MGKLKNFIENLKKMRMVEHFILPNSLLHYEKNTEVNDNEQKEK